MPHAFARAIGLFVAAFAAVHLAPQASAQEGPGWVTLLDGKSLGDWNRVGTSNWRLEDGAVVADKRTSKGAAHLVSKNSYKNFQIRAEFWASQDANSGIFLRCSDPKSFGPRTCCEVNIFDQRKDPTYGTGAIVNFAEVNPMPRPAAMEHAGDHRQGKASGRDAQRTEDRGHQERDVHRRADYAATRRGRDQIPQGRDQGAVAIPARATAPVPGPRFARTRGPAWPAPQH